MTADAMVDDDLHAAAVSDFSQQLHLEASQLSAGRVAILLDQTLQPLDDATLLPYKDAGAVLHTARIRHPDIAWNRCPVLAEIDSASFAGSNTLEQSCLAALQELQPQQLRTGQGRSIGGWGLSDEPYERRAVHLSRTMLQARPGGAAAWLRLQDPRVLWALWPLLGPAQQSSLLGPASCVFLPDPAGRLQKFERAPGARKGFGVPLRLSAAQWCDVDNLEALHQMLTNLGPLAWEKLEPARCTAMAAMRRARAAKWHDRNDLAVFAHKAVTVHPLFEQHPQVAALLAKRQADDYFTALIDELSESDWQRIAHELSGH